MSRCVHVRDTAWSGVHTAVSRVQQTLAELLLMPRCPSGLGSSYLCAVRAKSGGGRETGCALERQGRVSQPSGLEVSFAL